MKHNRHLYFFTFLLFAVALSTVMLFSCKSTKIDSSTNSAIKKPNIIYILADDLGYGELGSYGQKLIETPHLDQLAQSGMRFTNHYTGAPVCAPARYMLLTGKHSGHAYIRGNDEWAERGDVWNYKAVSKDWTLEGQRPLPEGTKLLPSYLKSVGYTIGMAGKWGLGAPHTHSIPTKMGFDYFFGYNCQRQAHTFYPLHLYENENRYPLNNDTVPPSIKLSPDVNPNDMASYAKYNLNDYTPTIMFDKMISFIKQQKDKPFYFYWATPIPHNPIQAPQRWVDYYIKKFGEEEPYLGKNSYYPHKNPRAGYAAMISYLDEQVGTLVKFLKDNGMYENTIIMFSSDNGVTYTGGTDGKFFNSSGPFDEEYGRGKGFVYEGGIRVPLIASWPGKIKANTTSDLISSHYDLLATLADLTGFEKPSDTDGISMLPTLLGKTQHSKHDYLFWEFPEYAGQVAIRMGEWKVVRQNLKNDKKAPTLELYNLTTDPNEKINVANQHPELLTKAAEIFKKEHLNASVERFRIPLIETGLLQNK
jgi:arylsulfatase A-like enzyme